MDAAAARGPHVRNLAIFLAVWAVDGLAFFGIWGVLFNLYLTRLGFGPDYIGLLTGTGQAAWALGALPTAALTRRFSLLSLMVAGWVVTAVTIAVLLLAEPLLPASAWGAWFIVWHAVSWVGAALVTVAMVPYLVLITPTALQHRMFASQGAVGGAASFFGSVAAGILPNLAVAWSGGSLEQPAPYLQVLWLAPIAYLICGLILLLSRPPAATAAEAAAADSAPTVPARDLPHRFLWVLGLVVTLQTAADGTARSFINVYLDSGLTASTELIGLIMGLSQLMPVLALAVVPLLLRRTGPSGAMIVSSLLTAVALALLGALPTLAMASVGYIGLLGGAAIAFPARGILSQQLVPARHRATSSAVLTIGGAAGWGITAIVGGQLIVAVGYGGLFGLGTACALLAAGAIFWLVHPRRSAATAHEAK